MSSPQPACVQMRGPTSVIAVVPYLLGFHPENSFVILAMTGPHARVTAAFRFDLPDPPSTEVSAAAADHAVTVLRRVRATTAIGIGYGPGTLVTPIADAVRVVLPRAGMRLHDILRVDDGRYWSYLCSDPGCCPTEGVPIPDGEHPAARTLAAAGVMAKASRAVVAESITAVTGKSADAMAKATQRAEIAAASEMVSIGPAALRVLELTLVQDAITCYRDGGTITELAQLARIAYALTGIEIRDDAWARMNPDHRDAHLRLWTDLTRHAQPGYIAAPASLLAFVAWQAGDGALANLALDRALTDDPEYSMARLLRNAVDACLPPSAARLPMSPKEVAASYEAQRRR